MIGRQKLHAWGSSDAYANLPGVRVGGRNTLAKEIILKRMKVGRRKIEYI
jgi:hypothetical protein